MEKRPGDEVAQAVAVIHILYPKAVFVLGKLLSNFLALSPHVRVLKIHAFSDENHQENDRAY